MFVENRVQEIRRLVGPEYWLHCKGKENPADIPTRKAYATNLEEGSTWWRVQVGWQVNFRLILKRKSCLIQRRCPGIVVAW